MEFILLIGYTIGIYFIGIYHAASMMMDDTEELIDEYENYIESNESNNIIKSDKPDKIMIRIDYDEKEEYFFVYEEDTHKFIAHGKTWQEVEETIKERFPNQSFSISESHAKEIGII